LVKELLLMVSVPDAAPAEVGSNWTFKVAVWLEFSVRGKLAPEKEKPAPETVAELTVTGAVPVEVSIKVCVAGVFRVTLPKVMLEALMLSVGAEAVNWRENVSETLPVVAVSVAD
jgi:hypothetical protein